jgi:hypothetical protein
MVASHCIVMKETLYVESLKSLLAAWHNLGPGLLVTQVTGAQLTLIRSNTSKFPSQKDACMNSKAKIEKSRSLVLGNPDLLERIFEHLDQAANVVLPSHRYGYFPQIKKRDLFSVSLTSRTFSTPAIRVLWRHMDTLWPLFQLLPTLQMQEPEDVNFVSAASV